MTGSSEFDVTLDGDGNPISDAGVTRAEDIPSRIGRYRIDRILGEGGFGIVYLAYDEQLQRQVAVKVPNAALLAKSGNAENYLVEARTVAKLDHPNIVPVYDVGSTEDCPCYVVSRFIEGMDLATKLKSERLRYRDSVELVATLGAALHYAHKQRVFHRDVKPGNIIIDRDNRPYIVDFGLALTDENLGEGPKCAGTPAYMSPEQARGEGHRVDGRSDVFSLGVVLYEMLSGRRPFKGANHAELMDQVTKSEPRPLRQSDESLPRELERIVQKAMAKRASDRYSTAHDFSEDLWHLLDLQGDLSNSHAPTALMSQGQPATPVSTQVGSTTGTGEYSRSVSGSKTQIFRIVPKGLRSFDAHDSDFFTELLPGPRDRNGLPDNLRFWKTRIEERDADETFAVGLIYGPSGCGKSSLVKAGLLPRLTDDVVSLYIEATPDGTESRLLNGLQKKVPELNVDLSLKQALTSLRRDPELLRGRKLVIFLDQFEQWLHANREETNDTQLVHALRQCDGARVQCVVMVRDDFWLAVTRFLRELEIRLVEGGNSAVVDLFDQDHARRVLSAFGTAFGRLSDDSSEWTPQQRDFLQQAVDGLSVEGKVISVRLALFAEMMKGKPWESSTLTKLGGTKGVGVTFLDESFDSSTAPPEHRLHQKAARAVLQNLLPEAGTDIKGFMRPRSELLQLSGYADNPRDFNDLIRILDGEMRLITPTDPAGSERDAARDQSTAGETYYQLTHDYLVHSLRDWLTQKQKETRKGRAELRLRDLSATWNARPENRFLPTWMENISLRWLTDRSSWTEPQARMMKAAAWLHGLRTAGVACLLCIVLVAGLWTREQSRREGRRTEAARLVEGLLRADINELAGAIRNLEPYRDVVTARLTDTLQNSEPESRQRLHAALALLPQQKDVLPFLNDRLIAMPADQFVAVRELLRGDGPDVATHCRHILDDQQQPKSARFQAACALAGLAPSDERWDDPEHQSFVANQLVSELPSRFAVWVEALRPVRESLIPELSEIFRDRELTEKSRLLAEDALLDFLRDQPQSLFEMLLDADDRQFETVYHALESHLDKVSNRAKDVVRETFEPDFDDAAKEALSRRQTNAAVLLLKTDDSETAWSLLKFSEDPRVRSRLIHSVRPMGVDPDRLVDQVLREFDASVRSAILQALGEFRPSELDGHQQFTESVRRIWRESDDAELHSAAEWLLKRWDDNTWLEEAKATLEASDEQLRSGWSKRWYVNGQGQTFVIVDGDEFTMGSPSKGADRKDDERSHRRRIKRTLAACTTEVTHQQWREFSSTVSGVWQADNPDIEPYVKSDDSPMVAMTWYEAAFYCNWLSDIEGIPRDQWCYEPNADGVFTTGMKAKDNFLDLTGYRLPTEAEWEFLCRSGTVTSRSFAESDELLNQYCWSIENAENRVWPVGILKPNHFGLFDMHGNAFEWCCEVYAEYPEGEQLAADYPGSTIVDDVARRALRSGCFYFRASNIRSAHRNSNQPGNRDSLNSFRPVRTWK